MFFIQGSICVSGCTIIIQSPCAQHQCAGCTPDAHTDEYSHHCCQPFSRGAATQIVRFRVFFQMSKMLSSGHWPRSASKDLQTGIEGKYEYISREPMNREIKYERLGRFIYGAGRYGGSVADVHNWMADELRIELPIEGDETAQVNLLDDYLAKYHSDEQFSESHQRFMKMMEMRPA